MQKESLLSYLQQSQLHAFAPTQCHPFVKWAGGKTQLLSELDGYSPRRFERYFEPFLGGGAFFFYLASVKHQQIKASYLSDVNAELINAYKVVNDDVEKLIELLSEHQRNYNKDR